MKNQKYHTVRTVPKSNRKIVEIGNIDTPNTYIAARIPGLVHAIQLKMAGLK